MVECLFLPKRRHFRSFSLAGKPNLKNWLIHWGNSFNSISFTYNSDTLFFSSFLQIFCCKQVISIYFLS
jgi:hypothetical protein